MSRTRRPLSELIDEYMLLHRDENSLTKYMTRPQCVLLFQRGIRELNRTVGGTLKSVITEVPANGLLEYPADYVKYTKIGVIDDDGKVRTLGRNHKINIARSFAKDINGDLVLDADGIETFEDDKQRTTTPAGTVLPYGSRNFVDVYHNVNQIGTFGNVYGTSAERNHFGHYRPTDDGIEFASDMWRSTIILEYIADETMKASPMVLQPLEEALIAYVYWRYVQHRVGISGQEKILARKEYKDQVRIARLKMRSFTLDELRHAAIMHSVNAAPKT